ncbi:hypothetical protein OHB44_21410 [Micromonospora sp. NBC_00821]|nr:hypothetical protein OHB44_21410 [Micromonospora sp. NBC_00821]
MTINQSRIGRHEQVNHVTAQQTGADRADGTERARTTTTQEDKT